ncbi:MAG: hypothetical protein ABIT76_03350 [Chthoniobacterales bacterium]
MKRKLLIGFATIVSIFAMDWVHSAPDRQWKSVHPGMSRATVTSLIGIPATDVKDSKGIQIWINAGAIRTTSFAAMYYDENTPEIVTHTTSGTRWVWERF